MDIKQKLIYLIDQSSLSAEDKSAWSIAVESYPEQAVESFLDIFSNFPEEIVWFNDLYKRKTEAFQILKENEVKGWSLLQEIFSEEKNKLEQFLT